MSENVNQIYQKKYGSRAEVYNGVAFSTRGHLKREDLFVDENGVLQSKKQVDSLKAKTVSSSLKNVPEVEEDEDITGDEKDLTKAIDCSTYTVSDLKNLITQMYTRNNLELPKMTKMKKSELVMLAKSIGC
jgi:hypothetical protein